ncbi:unnamed protein product [Cyprideis torosa]|uniref:Ubiquitin-conjugating enzyme E2 J2 n=1 Tax=Cyprideis torosa TaxID=163714 RepID=A0A7R8WGL9_9CRUS|nr:unnamed protein product [Cyprideis torosa]CAG0893129.1 unnamed protein product [Cyprideis torosa]
MGKRSIPSTASSRLAHDYLKIKRDPVPYVVAEPLPLNILEWHYVVRGPPDSPYEGGLYHGKLIFPSEFPFKPPSILMMTPNGRFVTNTRLCLSISDFHPDTWNPAWNVSTILTGLLSFMLESSRTHGSIETSRECKRSFAYKSLEFNLRDETFKELFPDLVTEIETELSRRSAAATEELNRSRTSGGQEGERSSTLQSFLLNVVVIALFTLFAGIVKWVVSQTSVID